MIYNFFRIRNIWLDIIRQRVSTKFLPSMRMIGEWVIAWTHELSLGMYAPKALETRILEISQSNWCISVCIPNGYEYGHACILEIIILTKLRKGYIRFTYLRIPKETCGTNYLTYQPCNALQNHTYLYTKLNSKGN